LWSASRRVSDGSAMAAHLRRRGVPTHPAESRERDSLRELSLVENNNTIAGSLTNLGSREPETQTRRGEGYEQGQRRALTVAGQVPTRFWRRGRWRFVLRRGRGIPRVRNIYFEPQPLSVPSLGNGIHLPELSKASGTHATCLRHSYATIALLLEQNNVIRRSKQQ